MSGPAVPRAAPARASLGLAARRAAREWRVALGLHGLRLLLAGLSTLAVGVVLGERLDRSIAADGLRAEFDVALIWECLRPAATSPVSSTALPAQALLPAGGALLLLLGAHVCVSGGLLASWHRSRRLEGSAFLLACWRHAGPLACLSVGTLVGTAGLGTLARRTWQLSVRLADAHTPEWVEPCLAACVVVLVATVGVALRVVCDVAQAAVVLDGGPRRWRRAARLSALTLRRQGGWLWLAYAGLAGLAVVLAALGAWAWLGQSAGQSWWPVWLWAQLCVLGIELLRFWQRASAVLACAATQVELAMDGEPAPFVYGAPPQAWPGAPSAWPAVARALVRTPDRVAADESDGPAGAAVTTCQVAQNTVLAAHPVAPRELAQPSLDESARRPRIQPSRVPSSPLTSEVP